MILDQIVDHKRAEITLLRKRMVRRDFGRIFKNSGGIGLIAEIKLASPSTGVLADETSIEKRVRAYEAAGADAISVVVDKKFFGGDTAFINRIKQTTKLPVLAKDFIVDPYQLYELKQAGADAVLLIAKIVSQASLISLVNLAHQLDLEPVVEVQSELELKKALAASAKCIAVNARNLRTFRVDVNKACALVRKIPRDRLVCGFSGVKTRAEARKYFLAGAKAILVGTSLMRSTDVGELIGSLKDVRPVVKICGVRTQDAADTAIKSGVDMIGFNFIPTSKRYISVSDAHKIISRLPKSVKKVGIFQNQILEEVNTIAKKLKLDCVQLHGREAPKYCRSIVVSVIKTMQLESDFDVKKTLKKMHQYQVETYLVDRKIQGTGQVLDMRRVRRLASETPLILAGGLTVENVERNIQLARPFGVDVASGVERDSKQDPARIAQFVQQAKGTNEN